MERNEILSIIREKLFYGSADYTKNQPDLFLPHRFQILASSQMDGFLETVRASLPEEQVLVYVHLPFCVSECLFCNSFPQKANREAQEEYLANLLKEIDLFSQSGIFKGKKARCIYFGGGTPTSFSNRDLGRILEKLASVIEFSPGCNITTESHPAMLAHTNRMPELRTIGINRVSIGCQTFDQEVLRLCNRSNTEEQISRTVQEARNAGISINIDMMTGLPGQTIASVMRDLSILDTIRPDAVEYIRHEIVNPLVVGLYKDQPGLVVKTDDLFEMVLRTQEWMGANGYEQNGRFTGDAQWPYRYHWLKEMPIIAFGARARSYTKTLCYDKYEELSSYAGLLKRGVLPIGRYVALTKREQMYRSLLLGLQIGTGLERARFSARFGGDPLTVFSPLMARLKEYGCVEWDAAAIRLTTYGASFVEDVCDHIMDAVLKEESDRLVRVPHSEGSTSSRLQ